jgi:uncharacterized membrane protein
MAINIKKELEKIVTNKVVLYIVLVLAITNVLGFMAVQHYTAVAIFVLAGLAASWFTPNMTIILVVAMIAASVLTFRVVTEGMTNKEKDSMEKASEDKRAFPVGDDSRIIEAENIWDGAAYSATGPSETDDNEEEKAETVEEFTVYDQDEAEGEAGAGEDDADVSINRKTTQQLAYSNLNKILGDSGFSKMTKDTEQLISQQNNLAQSMNALAPILQNAESLLKNLNIDKMMGMFNKLQPGAAAGAEKTA